MLKNNVCQYIVSKRGLNLQKNTIYSVIVYISAKSIKIKLDKENTAMLWKKISEKLAEKNWTVYKLCLKAGIGPAGIYRLRDGEVKDLYFDTVKKIADALEISIDELRQRGRNVQKMTEEEAIELLKFLRTDYGRGYLAGLVGGLSMFLKILKKAE